MDLSHLLPSTWKNVITKWIKEDIPSIDYAGYVVGDKEEVAILYAKSKGILAGKPFFEQVFGQLECRVDWLINEGDSFDSIIQAAKVYGKAKNILAGERVALNILARCSGIATKASRIQKLKETHNFKGYIAGTRKTTPGFRIVEKYGLLVAGVDTHRMDLSSMVMLKDNHIWSQGSIKKAVAKAKQVSGFSLKIEVECRTIEEAKEAIESGADVIMLDNMNPPELNEAANQLKQYYSDNHPNSKFLIEASGGVTENNIVDYFCDDVDIISMGSLTQGVPHVDFSLKIQKS